MGLRRMDPMENKYVKVGNVYKEKSLVNDDSVINLKDFKEAKIHLENLEHIKKILDLSLKGLKNFQAYTNAYETTFYLEGQKIFVEAYINKCKKILKKGKK